MFLNLLLTKGKKNTDSWKRNKQLRNSVLEEMAAWLARVRPAGTE